MKRLLFLVYINVSILCVLLVGAELAGQAVFYVTHGYPLYESYRHNKLTADTRVFEPHPYLVGRLLGDIRVESQNKAITTTPDHTRWTGAPANDPNVIQIAVLGGSTTFGTLLTDADSWPALLQDMMGKGYAVTNYGVPGYSTAEAIVQTALLLPEKRPQVVVLYEGWNDIKHYHVKDLGPDYYVHGMQQYTNLNLSPPDEPLLRTLTRVSAIFKVTSKIGGMLPWRTHNPSLDKGIYKTPDPVVDKLYLRNLTTLKTLAESQGAKVILVPQLLNDTAYAGKPGSHPWTPTIANDAMPTLMKRFDSILNDVCRPEDANCVVLGEVLAESWGPSDFLDEGHFSRSGGTKFARVIADRIKQLKVR